MSGTQIPLAYADKTGFIIPHVIGEPLGPNALEKLTPLYTQAEVDAAHKRFYSQQPERQALEAAQAAHQNAQQKAAADREQSIASGRHKTVAATATAAVLPGVTLGNPPPAPPAV